MKNAKIIGKDKKEDNFNVQVAWKLEIQENSLGKKIIKELIFCSNAIINYAHKKTNL